MQQIKLLIHTQLDYLFIEIYELVTKAINRQISTHEVLPQDVQQKLDQKVKDK